MGSSTSWVACEVRLDITLCVLYSTLLDMLYANTLTLILCIFLMTQSWQTAAQSLSKHGIGPMLSSWKNSSTARINLLPAAADSSPNTKCMQRKEKGTIRLKSYRIWFVMTSRDLANKTFIFTIYHNNHQSTADVIYTIIIQYVQTLFKELYLWLYNYWPLIAGNLHILVNLLETLSISVSMLAYYNVSAAPL